MRRHATNGDALRAPRVLPHAPAELTAGRLRRLGEGIGKVVYASDHWVVKRPRSQREIVALIVLWKILRGCESILPGRFAQHLTQRPSKALRFLRLLVQSLMLVLPTSIWFTTHIRQMWRTFRKRDRRGEKLARERLSGTGLVPETVTFPPARVDIGGYPGYLVVSEAVERVDTTLYDRIAELAAAGRFEEVEEWLGRYLDLRRAGWEHGLFSVDAHLKNFGVCSDRIVLLDSGGLTNRIEEVEQRFAARDPETPPHVELGLGPLLASRPDIAERFDARWRSVVNPAEVRRLWGVSSQVR